MVDVDAKTRHDAEGESAAITRAAEPLPSRIAPTRALRIFPLMITLAAVAVAVVLGRAMWDAYMGAPIDARRDGAHLCRDDGAASRRADRRALDQGQPVCPQGRFADGHRPDRLQDCRQPQRGGGAAGPGQCRECREGVDSIARAINVANAQPNGQGLANVNPIFTWVRLAQRIPVRVHIEEVPEGVVLAAGMTATVQINPHRARRRSKAAGGR